MIERDVNLFSLVLALATEIGRVLNKFSFYRREMYKGAEKEDTLRIYQHTVKHQLEEKLFSL